MSISSMSRVAARKPKQPPTMGVEGAARSPVSPSDKLKTALDAVATYIPSEVVGIYLGGMGILSPASEAEVRVVFVLCFLLTVIFCAATYRLNGGEGLRKLGILTLMSLVAYSAWAIAIPGNFLAIEWARATTWGGLAVFVLAALLPVIAKVASLDSSQ